MRKILDRVAITGADDDTKVEDMVRITEKYPWVEWGILVSGSKSGGPRFPSMDWIQNLQKEADNLGSLSMHVCGRWVRKICEGNWQELKEGTGKAWKHFDRFQLNFHAYLHKIKNNYKFIEGFKTIRHKKRQQFIFQLDNVNNEIVSIALAGGVNAVPFFDLSGGVGVLPKQWDAAEEGQYTGYAGGLSPDNVVKQLEQIERVCGEGPIWIDTETHVRSIVVRDHVLKESLDLEKVEDFLEAVSPWVRDDWATLRN